MIAVKPALIFIANTATGQYQPNSPAGEARSVSLITLTKKLVNSDDLPLIPSPSRVWEGSMLFT
jgi:hypothetical protein